MFVVEIVIWGHVVMVDILQFTIPLLVQMVLLSPLHNPILQIQHPRIL